MGRPGFRLSRWGRCGSWWEVRGNSRRGSVARAGPRWTRRPRSGGRSTSSRRARHGALAGRGPPAHRGDQHGHAGGPARPGARLGDALQLRAGERGYQDAEAELLPAGEPGVAQAAREGRQASRRPGPPSGGRGAGRLPRAGRARRGEGGALPERRPGGAEADGPGAVAASRPGYDQAAGGGGRSTSVDLLPHVPSDRDHGVSVERGDARGRRARRNHDHR